MSGVLCDERIPSHIKGEIHKVIVHPAILCGMETVPMTSSHVKNLEVTEMKICRLVGGHTLRDRVRNDDIRERLKVENITERCRKARLRWFGQVKRRDQEYVGRKTMEMVSPGRRRSIDRKDEVHDRTGCRRIVSVAATPQPSGSG